MCCYEFGKHLFDCEMANWYGYYCEPFRMLSHFQYNKCLYVTPDAAKDPNKTLSFHCDYHEHNNVLLFLLHSQLCRLGDQNLAGHDAYDT